VAIHAIFHQQGEFAAAVKLRRLFPVIADAEQARECAWAIAGWIPLPRAGKNKPPPLPR
jgi:hypothetical protein